MYGPGAGSIVCQCPDDVPFHFGRDRPAATGDLFAVDVIHFHVHDARHLTVKLVKNDFIDDAGVISGGPSSAGNVELNLVAELELIDRAARQLVDDA